MFNSDTLDSSLGKSKILFFVMPSVQMVLCVNYFLKLCSQSYDLTPKVTERQMVLLDFHICFFWDNLISRKML